MSTYRYALLQLCDAGSWKQRICGILTETFAIAWRRTHGAAARSRQTVARHFHRGKFAQSAVLLT